MKGSRIFLLLLFLMLSSCAGYHVSFKDNPLLSYDIRSISVPMFVNRSVFPNAAAPMTQEIILLLNQYQDLKVVPGESLETDAILLGIIDSKQKLHDAVTVKTKVYTDGKKSLGQRPDFYYPSELNYDLSVRYILIKRPSREELTLFQSDIGKFLTLHPKAIINEVISLRGSYQRIANSATDGGDVNGVKNIAIFEKSFAEMSRTAALNFRDLILNAF